MSLQLDPHHLGLIQGIFCTSSLERDVFAFGSRARGDNRRYSDLDLVIIGEPIRIELLIALKDAFLDSDLPFKVDILQWDQLSAEFRTQIRDDLKEIYKF